MKEFHRRFQPDVEVSGPDFLLELPPELCAVRADPDKLSRALQNLVFNAVSFTPEDPPPGPRVLWPPTGR